MRNFLFILLLMLFFPLRGEERAVGICSRGQEERWELVTNIFLGMEVRPLSSEERASYGKALPARNGLLITKLAPGGPAEKAGLKEGELLLFASGADLASREDLLICLRNFRPGVPAHFTCLRDGEWKVIKLVPEERSKPAVVGYLLPHKLHTERAAELKPRQMQIARMLAGDTPPNLSSVHSAMESFSKILCSSYMPGNLRLEFSSCDCSISVIRYWECITVTMVENSVETTSELKKEGDALPAPMRLRLREMAEDMAAAKP